MTHIVLAIAGVHEALLQTLPLAEPVVVTDAPSISRDVFFLHADGCADFLDFGVVPDDAFGLFEFFERDGRLDALGQLLGFPDHGRLAGLGRGRRGRGRGQVDDGDVGRPGQGVNQADVAFARDRDRRVGFDGGVGTRRDAEVLEHVELGRFMGLDVDDLRSSFRYKVRSWSMGGSRAP